MNAIQTALRALNHSASLLKTKRNCYIFLGVVLIGIVGLGGYYITKRWFSKTATAAAAVVATSTPPPPPPPPPPKATAMQDLDERAARLVKESARHVQQALETQKSSPMTSYESAVAANVLAMTAEEIAPNTNALSQHIGVNFHKYIQYTSDVMKSTQRRLNRRLMTH